MDDHSILNYNSNWFNRADGVSNRVRYSGMVNDYPNVRSFRIFDIKLGYAYTSLLTLVAIVDNINKVALLELYYISSI